MGPERHTSPISFTGRSRKIQNLNILHLFVALLQEAHFPKVLKGHSMPTHRMVAAAPLQISLSIHSKIDAIEKWKT